MPTDTVLFTTTVEGFSLLAGGKNPSGRRTRKVRECEVNRQSLAARLKSAWGDRDPIHSRVSLSFAVHKVKGTLSLDDARASIIEALSRAGIVAEPSLVSSAGRAHVIRDGSARVAISLRGDGRAVIRKGQMSLV
jgi:hypothetical protein